MKRIEETYHKFQKSNKKYAFSINFTFLFVVDQKISLRYYTSRTVNLRIQIS